MAAPEDQDAPYQVSDFSWDGFCGALSNRHCSADELEGNRRTKYLYDYLRDLEACKQVVEVDYVDGDYLDDFASYYVKCFSHYESRCKRLHFFRAAFSDGEFLALVRGTLSDDKAAQILGSYVGFIVARPLPQAVIGRTVLATYPREKPGGQRHYTCVIPCEASLFGVPLRVHSLPHQEQDRVLAKCATVSLWASFHRTRSLFGSAAPRPAAITQAATQYVKTRRAIPSRGLNVEQICAVISEVGLEPEIFPVSGEVPLRTLLYSYLSFGLPVVLGIEVEGAGNHAIALAGFSLLSDEACETRKVPKDEVATRTTSIPMIGRRIDEFYGHDDQVGPFARIVVSPPDEKHPVVFVGSWIKAGKKQQMYPNRVIVAVYNKIRVTFTDIYVWLTRLNGVMQQFAGCETAGEWDINLTTTNDYKAELESRSDRELKNVEEPADIVQQLRLRQHPRFIWLVRLRFKEAILLEILADATDMPSSFPFYGLIWLDKAQLQPLINAFADQHLQDETKRRALAKSLGYPLFEFLRNAVGEDRIYLRPKRAHRQVF